MVSRSDNREAIGRLYDECGHLVYRRCLQMMREPEAAMDATQWTFMRALEVGFEVQTRGQSLKWLYSTASRRCLWQLRNRSTRRRLRTVFHGDLLPPPIPSAESRVVDRDLVAQALALVSERTGQLALLTYVQGLSHDRAAEICGVSLRTVGRARREFEDALRAVTGREEAG